jgi:hypothetical protein
MSASKHVEGRKLRKKVLMKQVLLILIHVNSTDIAAVEYNESSA